MLKWRCRSLLFGLAFALALAIPYRAAAEPLPRPRLAVLICFDQLRGDYLGRWEKLFGTGGFRRLMQEGAWFSNCHYPYAVTVTGAGHTSLVTGCSPAQHGIIDNDWYDRTAGDFVYCVGSERYEQVPRAEQGKSGKLSPGSSPERLLVPTLGDALKEATDGKGKVVSLSLKDRSAVLPGGRRADVCYWFDPNTGLFVTSTYYRAALHPWVATFNQVRPADRWFGRDWTRLRPDLDYEKLSGPDDVEGEGSRLAYGRTFPHALTGSQWAPGREYYLALYNSPFGNELLLDLAKRAIDAEELGTDDIPDLLCLSFSSNDAIGHVWGPDSQEVLDVTLRSDRILQELLDYLDAKVGKGQYVLALTSDHGVAPLPEVARARGKDAGRIPPKLLKAQAETFLGETFGTDHGFWVEAMAEPWFYLNHETLRRSERKPTEVEETLAHWLRQQAGILTAYTRTQLQQGVAPDDAIGQAVLRSFHPERAGDVIVLTKPYYQILSYLTGTTHGSPHDYDTHVPLLVYGPGIRPAVHPERITPLATAVILARSLEVPPPTAAKIAVPPGLFTEP